MNGYDRILRNRKIASLYDDGMTQVALGVRFGLNPPRIRAILKTLGKHPQSENPNPHPGYSLWEQDARNRLRHAIWKRQREGARAALAAMRQP